MLEGTEVWLEVEAGDEDGGIAGREGEYHIQAQKIKLRIHLWWYFAVVYYKSPLGNILGSENKFWAYALGPKEIKLQTNFHMTCPFCYIYNIFELDFMVLDSWFGAWCEGKGKGLGVELDEECLGYCSFFAPGVIVFLRLTWRR